jgi:organic radical activating enzyme
MNQKDLPIYQKLESRSKFFCPRKWNDLFLYLNHGNSNSCSLPPPHQIPAELLDDPFVLHNTPHKLKMQQLMIDGHRPNECYSCWQIEDLNENILSDRLLHSTPWEQDISNLTVDQHHIPKFIEVVFDNVCNFSCSYCDSGQSSSWATIIKKRPFFLKSDTQHKYNKVWIKPGSTKQEYFDAWMKWWPSINQSVKYLRISGGEPLLSDNFWQFLEILKVSNPDLEISINSNLSCDIKTLEKFISSTTQFKKVIIAASIDASGRIAEFTRQGLDIETFYRNVTYYLDNAGKNFYLYLQSTTNVFGVWGLTDVFEYQIKLRDTYEDKIGTYFNVIVRAPEFQCIALLPAPIKQQLINNFSDWLSKREHFLNQDEISHVNKVVEFLRTENNLLGNDREVLRKDLARFTRIYEKNSKHKLEDIYPREFIEWLYS